MTSAATKNRQSYGLTLPPSADSRDSVVSNILSSLATLDETAQLQWIQETSRQVDSERAYQRRENGGGNSSAGRQQDGYNALNGQPFENGQAPTPAVGYRDRARNGSFSIPAPSPAVPMGRPSKQGFFRRFMGIGPKVPIEGDLLITTQPPTHMSKSTSTMQVREIQDPSSRKPVVSQPNIPDQSRLVKKKSSNFFRRRPKSAGDGMTKSSAPFSHQGAVPPLPVVLAPLPPPDRLSAIDSSMGNLRYALENYQVSNGSVAPNAQQPTPRQHHHTPPEAGYHHRPPHIDSDASAISDIFDAVQQNRLTSSATSHTSDSGKCLGKSPEPDKAKQVMGLNPAKPISGPQRKTQVDDGNITALEKEYADALAPQKPIFEVERTSMEDKGSEDIDRVKETARDIYNGTELLVALNDAARWLMNTNEFNTKVRTAYMELFDFMGLDILTAVRRLCTRLLLKGESQQLDRILESLAKRWYECNPENGMKDPDVVHALSYSIFLLNTDLHIVDIPSSQRMTRQQFIKNTMNTVLSQLPVAKRMSTAPVRSQPSMLPKGKLTTFPSASSPNLSHLVTSPNVSRSGSMLKVQQATAMARNPSAQSLDHGAGRPSRDSMRTAATAERLSWSLFEEKVGPFGGMAALGSHSAWEAQMECVLKDIYNSLKQTPLQQAQSIPSNDSNTALKTTGLGITRSASLLSQASHISDSGSNNGANPPKSLGRDWLGRSRSQPRLPQYPQESYISVRSAGRSSFEDRGKSPPNSGQAKHKRSGSNGRAGSSLSVESFNNGHDSGPSIGFANSLSQTIIREETHSGQTSFIDEEIQEHALILSGPPWAKEGVLKSKRQLETQDKKSRERNWTESFVVIDKGQMRLFQFESHRPKNTSHLGGGNWQRNANMIGSFLLRQTLASALPSPGYSKTRQHVWALTLPSGGVFFFEAGTAELVREWVESANYWAARTSKEPLRAGVSNMEWGWGGCLVDDDVTDDGTASIGESHRSTFEGQRSPTHSGKASYGGDSQVLKGDKAVIREWKTPPSSLMASSLTERSQLEALESFVKHLEEDFGQHNDIRPLMLKSFSPRHPNSTRALANWERKSQYLLREIVKYKTYVEILSRALVLREDLIQKSLASKPPPSPDEEKFPPPEPWFDLNLSAPNSVSTETTIHTKETATEEPVKSG